MNEPTESRVVLVLAAIRRRLDRPAKLRRDERDNLETAISNLSGNGDLTDAEYRSLTRALRAHA